MKILLATMSVGVMLCFTAQTVACGGSRVLFEDQFSSADLAWGNYSDLRIENGSLTLLVNPGAGYPLHREGTVFSGDYEICTSVVQKNMDPSVAWASLLFWGADYENYYVFQVATNGYVNVARRKGGVWQQNPVGWKKTSGLVNPGMQPNELRLVIKGSQVTGYVNQTKVLSFKGRAPKGASFAGVYGNAPDGLTASYDFDYFKVTEVD
ncbi:hypothetical protein [Aminobacter sp. MET-1]|uniref:hypothetical protein n=1 Tax=Aminobacter sp. MET-1 TaxID=2951085 RepID=UPI00226ADA3D|nr:hypothetical protein [Aminobacter sp. MET-1]MCX8570745.1 hypothetical protein [Aminobacter sp. MET-1]